MDYSKFGKNSSWVLGLICGFIGCGVFDGLMVVAKRFPEAGLAIMTVVIVFILLILAVFLTRIQGYTGKKVGMGLGVIAICVAIALFYLYRMDYFVQDIWRILAPVSGIVLLFGGGAVSLSSYFSMLDQQHRAQERNDKKV